MRGENEASLEVLHELVLEGLRTKHSQMPLCWCQG